LIRIIRAQKINQVVGGAAVMPWEVDELPDEWMDAFAGIADDLPEVTAMVRAQEKVRDEWLKKSGYRSYAKK
jgi:hypothetical protein